MKKISVIVPVYNVEQYLEKCLDSILNQTLKDIEIIVVNDGSPDNSQKIIDKYQKKYKNIKGYIKENGGLSDARNFGLTKATGEYISFIDSDDYIDSTMLEKMYNKAKQDDLDIVVCDSIEVYPDGREIRKVSNFNYSDNIIKNYIFSPPMACTRIYKKYIFDKVNFQKGIYYEDLNFTPSLVSITKKVGFVEEGLYYYVQRNNSIMKQLKYNEKLLDIFTVLDNNKKKLYKEYKDEIEYLYVTHLLRSASLRFVNYKEAKELLDKVVNTMISEFPKYKENPYYKKSSFKLKTICFFAFRKNIFMLKLLKKLAGV